MTLTLDRAVQMDDGYLIYATMHWKDTPFTLVDVTDPDETLHLLDANGQEMLYELHYDEQTGIDVDQRQTVFAIKTAPVQILRPADAGAGFGVGRAAGGGQLSFLTQGPTQNPGKTGRSTRL